MDGANSRRDTKRSNQRRLYLLERHIGLLLD
jgi:hypothetical protein